MFKFEQQLDELIAIFAENRRVYIENVPEHLKNDIEILINVLTNYGYIEPVIIIFLNSRVPSEKEFVITPSGMAFYYCKDSFIRKSEYYIKSHKKLKLEIFKLRWDIIMSSFAIVVSVVALLFSIFVFFFK